VRLVTWNVNSLKARQERVEQWLAECQPDVVCMQETKLADTAFPTMAFSALGYESAHHGEGRWNGVSIISRVGLDDVVFGFADGEPADPEARLLTATCDGVRVMSAYVPNGRALDHEHYQYKLAWLERLRAHLDAVADPTGDVALCGDFNIAPADRDVWDAAALVDATHVSVPEREALQRLLDWGLTDVFRDRYPDTDRLFSWWDYRAGNFHKGIGMRIDLVLGSASFAERVRWALIDRNARKGKQPSDHAPLVVDLEEAA
jgi:exodeoxyribonuclease-3